MAGWSSPWKIAVLDDIQHFGKHISYFLKVGRGEFDSSHRIIAASEDDKPFAHSTLKMFLYEQCINGRLKSQCAIDQARISSKLVIERSGGPIVEKQHLINATTQAVAFADNAHVDPLIHCIQSLSEIAAIGILACFMQRTAHLNLRSAILELGQHLVLFEPSETRAVEMFQHVADGQQDSGEIKVHKYIHISRVFNSSVTNFSSNACPNSRA